MSMRGDIGTDWLRLLGYILASFGALSLAAFSIWLWIWLFTHVRVV